MLPSDDQIGREAFFRWQRRGGAHGRDREDWLAAEQDLLFALNYEVAAHYLLDGGASRAIGEESRRTCRFCELAEPATSFSAGRLALPGFVGNRSLFTHEECDECHDLFATGIEADLGRFLAGFRPMNRAAPGAIPLSAFKGLVKLALSVMPRGGLPDFEGAVEWVVNPDHDFDADLFRRLGLGCRWYHLSIPAPHPWAALSRRVDDDAPVPFMLFSLGTTGLVLQLAVPLCERDDDLDGTSLVIPRTCAPFVTGLGADPDTSEFLPVAPPATRPAAGRGLLGTLLNPPHF